MLTGCGAGCIALAQDLSQPIPSSQVGSNWQRYTIKGEEFSVLLPTLPAMTTQEVRFRINQHRLERTIGAYADGVVYAIYTLENPPPRQSLNEIMAEFPRSAKNFKRELKVGKIEGKEYGYRTNEVTGVTQFYLTEKHAYVFEAVGSALGSSEVGIPKFLESIKFGMNLEGLNIVDGPGQSASPLPIGEILSTRVVDQKVRVVTKPEPSYTERARRNGITGTVVMRCIFSAHGSVTNIHIVSGLPDGLDERAIGAAHQIRFIPAIKDGRFVSMWMELHYNFNLY